MASRGHQTASPSGHQQPPQAATNSRPRFARGGQARRPVLHSVGKFSYSSLKLVYDEIEMRAFLNSLMAALVVMALFWGNCFSCPQILLAAQKHGCCPHGKSEQKECKTQGLRNFVKADPVVKVVPFVVQGVLVPVPVSAALRVEAHTAPLLVSFSPPDLLPLRI